MKIKVLLYPSEKVSLSGAEPAGLLVSGPHQGRGLGKHRRRDPGVSGIEIENSEGAEVREIEVPV